jgi:invasion protein IalB
MAKRWILVGGIPAALAVGAVAAFFMIGTESKFGWQLAQVTPPASGQEKKPVPASPSTAATSPTAPGKPAEQSAGPGWALNCKSGAKDKALDCRLSQTVVTQNGQMLADVTFLFPAAPQKSEMNIQLPLGVLLPDGTSVKVDQNTPMKVSFRNCNRGGCFAVAPISPEFLAALRKGKELSIEFKDLASTAITVPVSLDGFPEAYAKMPSS